MGSSNSRVEERSRLNRFKRRLLASLFCASSVSRPLMEMGDHVDESLTGSLENLAPCRDESISLKRQHSPSSETELSSSSAARGTTSGSSSDIIEDTSGLSGLSKNGELHSQRVNVDDAVIEAQALSTSVNEQPPMASVSAGTTVVSHADQGPGNVHSEGESIRDVSMDFQSTGSGSQLPSGVPLSNIEQDPRAASVLFVDLVSVHSNNLSSNIAEISRPETRRNSRRMFWDAFSRSIFRRNRDSPTIVFTTGHADDLGSHDRWLLDFSGDLHYDGVGRESRYSGARSRHRRWQSRYEMSERFHDVHDEQGWQTTLCSAGLHPRGTCACESLFEAEEPYSRGTFGQIIMLADALFEVLEEIHRHRLSLSPSMLSLPAPEAIVSSFPLKNHKKSCRGEGGNNDVQQCHICLVDYEEGDEIRVLPCSHEYHMSCVDKWLKEIHRVCPLCRDDVCKGAVEGSASNLEITSL